MPVSLSSGGSWSSAGSQSSAGSSSSRGSTSSRSGSRSLTSRNSSNGEEVTASPRLAFLRSVRDGEVNSFQYQKEKADRETPRRRDSSSCKNTASGNAADRRLD